jgi:hypothetical protein
MTYSKVDYGVFVLPCITAAANTLLATALISTRWNLRLPFLKRGINGIFHAVSKKHLHRYVGEFDFRWNTRKLNDGDRIVAAIRSATGKRLMHRYVEPDKAV